ncbi:hypothetical protein CLPUN_00090 [Clostridium puniceum]|uniref:YcxB-like protein domain-containing protein n=1 Tax=Clostridium puniceum TaxID=29367 RepID=A0A1S8TXT7_9CLOT|nr:hypothetical protein [Clostridium puniceum]OOM82623.1 hypothetical protein CLPUN_00090 [Clostridium puniceum]
MEVSFKISKDELIDFHMEYIDETRIYNKQIRSYTIYVSAILFGIILLLRSSLYTITVLICYSVFFLFRKRIFKWRLMKKVSKIYESDIYTNIFETTNLSFIDDGIKTSTKFSEKIFKWSSVKGLYLVAQYILIKTINSEDLLIPIFSFNSVEDRELFLDIIIKNTNLELKKQYPNDI